MPAGRLVAAAAVLAALTACSPMTNGAGSRGTPIGTAAGSTGAQPSKSAGTSAPSAPPTPTTASAPSSTSASVQPAPSTPLRTASVHAGTTTYVIKVWATATDHDCVGHAHGTPVLTYLRAHPCLGVTRLLATTTVSGRAVGFAQSSIEFAGPAPQVYLTAGNFGTLVTKDGTGNINDLLREGRRLPSGPTAVPSPDAFSALGQDDGVTIVDAWYLQGPTPDDDPALVKMAHDIFLQY